MMHLAELNIAQMKGENIDAPIMASFVAQLDEINALAESSTGFVWRLKDDTGDATNIKAFDDPRVIVNMSVWESLEALEAYVFSGRHMEVMKNRREWFNRMATMHMVLWWVPAGHKPTTEEAKERLEYLQKNGASKHAFSFRQKFHWE
jgi:heme-degrading monooxygenase HmoA